MKETVRRHSWWVWVLVVAAGWGILAFATPKIHDLAWVRDRPAIYGPR